MKTLLCLALLVGLTAPPAAWAQRRGEIAFYSDIAFRGRSYVVSGPRETVNVPFTVRSARIAPGEAWEICTETRYRGRCNTADDTVGNIAWQVGSVRPARAAPGPGPAPPGRDQSLRGMSAEFFTQPTERGGRVPSCRGAATAACAAESADRFCRSRGWTASSYERQETVAGRVYLADVLCTRTR